MIAAPERTEVKPRDRLRMAADIIRQRGWTNTGNKVETDGRVCLLGAIALAHGWDLKTDESDDDETLDEFLDSLPEVKALALKVRNRGDFGLLCDPMLFYKRVMCDCLVMVYEEAYADTVWGYNDTSGTTQSAVIKLLEETIVE
jgi:hypothetical protein